MHKYPKCDRDFHLKDEITKRFFNCICRRRHCRLYAYLTFSLTPTLTHSFTQSHCEYINNGLIYIPKKGCTSPRTLPLHSFALWKLENYGNEMSSHRRLFWMWKRRERNKIKISRYFATRPTNIWPHNLWVLIENGNYFIRTIRKARPTNHINCTLFMHFCYHLLLVSLFSTFSRLFLLLLEKEFQTTINNPKINKWICWNWTWTSFCHPI